ncbi:unnamed protein product [Nippostrongylus brasiliensis]|uniref:Phosphatidate cytidylyltransferase n=1 Tax=Nippostrongylus brasiliensis TaxID=27835 RepID=A0A0N4YXR8_NIPBR|nr:unnamed protein product [Nippostrongylus brasiliensis]
MRKTAVMHACPFDVSIFLRNISCSIVKKIGLKMHHGAVGKQLLALTSPYGTALTQIAFTTDVRQLLVYTAKWAK